MDFKVGPAFSMTLNNSTPEHGEGPSEAVAVPGLWEVPSAARFAGLAHVKAQMAVRLACNLLMKFAICCWSLQTATSCQGSP